jgi:hypothetical protein
MELEQEGWLKQQMAKVVANRGQRGPIAAGDQGSDWVHQGSETTLTEDSRSVGASPWCEQLPPGGKQTVDPLDQ